MYLVPVNPADGAFQLGDLPVCSGLSLAAFEASSPGAGARARTHVSYGREGVSARVEGPILGRDAICGLEFKGGRLARVSIFVRLPGDGASWDDWTFEQEMRRKRAHDDLARDLFGNGLALRPMDVNGKAILPLDPGPEYPRHAVFDWGEVVSGYDSKGGMAEMWIAYAPVQERTP